MVDENGELLSLMFVVAARILAGSDAPQRVPHQPASTDDLGRYRIYGLEPGEYFVAAESRHTVSAGGVRESRTAAGTRVVEPPGFPTTFHPSAANEAAAQRIRLTAGRDASGIDIQVARARSSTSPALCSTPAGPAPATNGVLSRDGVSGARSHSFYTDAQGRFQVRALEPGNYRLLIGRGGGVNGRVEFADAPLTVAGDVEGPDPGDRTWRRRIGPGRAGGGTVPRHSNPADHVSERSGVAVRAVETIATMDDDRRFRAQDVFGPHLVRVAGLLSGSTVRAVMLRGTGHHGRADRLSPPKTPTSFRS